MCAEFGLVRVRERSCRGDPAAQRTRPEKLTAVPPRSRTLRFCAAGDTLPQLRSHGRDGLDAGLQRP